MKRPWPTWRGGGCFVAPKNKQRNSFLHSVTQSLLLTNTLLCIVLSSTGIITVDSFCILVVHKVLSKVFSFISVKNIFFVTGYIIIVLQLTILILWLNNHDTKIQNCVYYLIRVSSVCSIDVCNLFRRKVHRNSHNVTPPVCTFWYFVSKSQKQPSKLATAAKLQRYRTCFCQSESRKPSSCPSNNGSITRHDSTVAYY